MKVTIYVRENDLEEIHHFLNSAVKYEHRVEFYSSNHLLSFPTYQVIVDYEDLVMLNDWKMQSTEHPYYPKESRTKGD